MAHIDDANDIVLRGLAGEEAATKLVTEHEKALVALMRASPARLGYEIFEAKVDETRKAVVAAIAAPPGWIAGAPVRLAECPPGPFLFNERLGFKSEYGADAYTFDSGEFFWGGTSKKEDREEMLVQPLTLRQPGGVLVPRIVTNPIVDAMYATWAQGPAAVWREVLRAAGALWRPTHRHLKRKTLYRVVGIAKLQADRPVEDETVMVLYEDEEGAFWVRTPAEFGDGRFEPVSKGETP